MHRRLRNTYFLLFTFLFSCTNQVSQSSPKISFYVYRPSPAAFVEFSSGFQSVGEIPFSLPPGCGLFDVFPAPIGRFLVIELSCPSGQTVLFLDTDSGAVTQPVTDSDSHFLAWTPDGEAVYLKVDSLGATRIARVTTAGRQTPLASIEFPEFTYDLAPSPDGGNFTFAFSLGMGHGSELWLTKYAGKTAGPLYADQFYYISLTRFSPDGSRIAFIRVPDTQTPFTVGELWVMDADGSNPRKLADADAGHGYAASWSPDGKRIAFVVRENPRDAQADQSSEALIGNIYIADMESGAVTSVTKFEVGYAETPLWSSDGNTLAFNVVINDRMEVRIADLATGQILPLMAESTCCPAWLRK